MLVACWGKDLSKQAKTPSKLMQAGVLWQELVPRHPEQCHCTRHRPQIQLESWLCALGCGWWCSALGCTVSSLWMNTPPLCWTKGALRAAHASFPSILQNSPFALHFWLLQALCGISLSWLNCLETNSPQLVHPSQPDTFFSLLLWWASLFLFSQPFSLFLQMNLELMNPRYWLLLKVLLQHHEASATVRSAPSRTRGMETQEGSGDEARAITNCHPRQRFDLKTGWDSFNSQQIKTDLESEKQRQNLK